MRTKRPTIKSILFKDCFALFDIVRVGRCRFDVHVIAPASYFNTIIAKRIDFSAELVKGKVCPLA
jgi:hypothetical protein